jgi:hypothetical protein
VRFSDFPIAVVMIAIFGYERKSIMTEMSGIHRMAETCCPVMPNVMSTKPCRHILNKKGIVNCLRWSAKGKTSFILGADLKRNMCELCAA